MHATPSAGYQHLRLTAGGSEAVHGFIGALGHARPLQMPGPRISTRSRRPAYSDSPALFLRHAAVGATLTNSAAGTERAS